MYKRQINDSVIKEDNNSQFIQIVSCNTHNIACITKTLTIDGLGPENLTEGRFVCVRRANDTSQSSGYIAAPSVGSHSDDIFGSHHAKDASELFATLGYKLNLFSSAMKINTQYMHVLWFALKTKEPTSRNEVIDKLEANKLVSITTKDIHEALIEKGFKIDRHAIDLQEPIKALGIYHITVNLAPDINGDVKIYIIKG